MKLSNRLKCLLCLWILLFLISGCGIFKPEPTITPLIFSAGPAVLIEPNNYKLIDCPFEVPEDMPPEVLRDIQCANLTVPEDRQQLDGPKIQLAVAIVKTNSTEPKPDPVLVLLGNPGYGLIFAYGLPYIFENISAQRDMIVIDQRGTGYSQPSFNCPELTELSNGGKLNLSLQEFNNQFVEVSSNCAATIKASRANLSAYTTSAVAADLEDLRQALGIKQWNIFTFFDGSQIALTMMRNYPQGIRSVILDSAVPLQANPAVEWGNNAFTTLDRLFQRCNEDEQCSKTYPNLKEIFYDLLDQLDQQPIQIDVANLYSGERYIVTLDSERLITLLLGLLNNIDDRDSLAEVPRMIFQLLDGKTEVAAQLMGRPSDVFPFPRDVMDEWMNCNEEFNFITLEQVDQANGNIGFNLRQYFNSLAEGHLKVCEQWNAPGVPMVENQPVGSSVPVLLLTGEFNVSEPIAWAEETAKTLRNSTVVEFSGSGQAVYASSKWIECSHSIVNTFLENPNTKPDTSCSSLPIQLEWKTLP